MSENKKGTQDGYQPKYNEQKGYQPQYVPLGDPEPKYGYQPRNTGDNPTNIPPPPKEE